MEDILFSVYSSCLEVNQLLSSHHVTVAVAHEFSVPGESIQATRPDIKILSDFSHPVFCLSYGPYYHWIQDPLISNELISQLPFADREMFP